MEELSKDVGVVVLDADLGLATGGGAGGGGGGGGGGGSSSSSSSLLHLASVGGVAAPGMKVTLGSPSGGVGAGEGTYLEGLIREKDALSSGAGMDLTKRLLAQEIERLQSGVKVSGKSEERKMADVTKDKTLKLTVRVLVPVRDHPKFNFVGKLLGPKGNSLKRLQEETMTKMAILGRGSMRDKQKEEELRVSGDPKFGHLSEDLHVEVTAVAPPAEAHARIAYALTEIRRYLVPDYNDEIRQGQMREMQLLVGTSTISNNNNNNNNNNNGTICGSEEGSCSPHSTGGSPPPPGVAGGRVRGAGLTLTSPHPALRGLNRAQAALLTCGKGELLKGRGVAGGGGGGAGGGGGGGGGGGASSAGGGATASAGRRSVLSLLTRARALQQKEQEMMDVYHDLPGYGLYDHLTELPLSEAGADDVTGRGGGGALRMSSPGERARFRHDPYPRVVPSST